MLSTNIVIYAEAEPSELGFWQLFFHSRLYKGVVRHDIDFTGKQDREEVSVRLR